MLENLICLFHDANNLHMSDLKSCLYKATMIFLQKQKNLLDISFPIQTLATPSTRKWISRHEDTNLFFFGILHSDSVFTHKLKI